ncbi:PaaI family thioesterase [Botryobacter ruber]|uniref:PaaI family thioesterase n=1 Tax=Botryobacter ruber TaxID=2171629 RepID=UPI000E0AEEAF|nr:PaaI family thioesterase [Botryobacter ruber]
MQAPEAHYRHLEHLYHSARIQNFYSGSQLIVRHGEAEITLPADPKYFHGAQALHGSVYFKMLDDAAYFAVASLVRDVFIVTTSFQLNLLRPVNEGTIRAIGKIRSRSKNMFVADAALFNEKGKEVAFGTGQFMRTDQALSSLEGYQ